MVTGLSEAQMTVEPGRGGRDTQAVVMMGNNNTVAVRSQAALSLYDNGCCGGFVWKVAWSQE